MPKQFYFLAIIIYYFDPNIFLINLSAIRQSVAIIFVLISIEFLLSNKYIYFLIAIIAAINFHFSSLILLPVIIGFKLFNGKLNIKYISVFLLIYFTAFILKDILKEYLLFVTVLFFENRYGTLESEASMSLLNFLAYLIILFFLFISHDKLENKYQLYAKLLIFAIVIIPIDFILPLAGRLTYYFLTLSIIVFPKIYRTINNYTLKYVFLFTILSIITIRLINFFNSETYSIGFGNYKTIFYH